MKTLILGSNGYIGNALIHHLDGDVLGVDNGSREELVNEIGSRSLTDVKRHSKTKELSVCNYDDLHRCISDFKPDTIVHLAQQPSAGYSMIGQREAVATQTKNTETTMNLLYAVKDIDPNIHIVKLGTAGEYPDWLYKDIVVPESPRITVKIGGKDWEIPTPRYAGSWYHFSKLFDSYNIDYACRIWGLNVTDINQGVVYGHIDGTRFDYDEYFGTVVNRFITQALIGKPLTVYGTGGQTRGFINLQNSIEAIELVIKNPVKGNRIIHQLTETLNIKEIAEMVSEITGCGINNIKNPRFEMESNDFEFEAKILKDLGLKQIKMRDSLPGIIKSISRYKDRINKRVIMPKTKWV